MLLKINPYEIIHQIFVSNFGLEKYAYIIKPVNCPPLAKDIFKSGDKWMKIELSN